MLDFYKYFIIISSFSSLVPFNKNLKLLKLLLGTDFAVLKLRIGNRNCVCVWGGGGGGLGRGGGGGGGGYEATYRPGLDSDVNQWSCRPCSVQPILGTGYSLEGAVLTCWVV